MKRFALGWMIVGLFALAATLMEPTDPTSGAVVPVASAARTPTGGGVGVGANSTKPADKTTGTTPGKTAEKTPAKTAEPATSGTSDTSTVLVVVEAGNPGTNMAKMKQNLEIGVKYSGLGAKALGGLHGIIGADPKTAAQDAVAAGAGSILMAKITAAPSDLDNLKVNVMILVPAGNGWKPVANQLLVQKGEKEGDMIRLEYAQMVDQWGTLLISKLFPYKVLSATEVAGKPTISVQFKNTSRNPIGRMTLQVPGKGLKAPVEAECADIIAPGEEKTVSFVLTKRPAVQLQWQQAVISTVLFGKMATE